jgi:hypothetical protein
MNHKQNLINVICLALFSYIGDDDADAFEILAALDAIHNQIVEELIAQHPEIVPQLATLMKLHNSGIKH